MSDLDVLPPFPPDVQRLAEQLGGRLRERGWSCATAESCTGGGIAHAITTIAGASDYFDGGIVAYANSVKQRLLGVRAETLERAGAVSEECAREMARGARAVLGVDLGIASTGIAGPGGATARKPVGLVYIAVSSPAGEVVHELRLGGNRAAVMLGATRQALALALEQCGAQAPETEHKTR